MKKYIIITLITLISIGLTYFLANGIRENNQVNTLIDTFKKNAIFDKEKSSNILKVYYVPQDTVIYPNSAFNQSKTRVGVSGDILVSRNSPFDNLFGTVTEYFFGGHAAIVSHSGESLYEVAGTSENNYVAEIMDNWLHFNDEFIGLRVNTSYENKIKVLDNIANKFGQPYNYSFIFNTKKSHYCTDLISKAYREVSQELKINDGFITSNNDLILSNLTYIFYYQEFINNVRFIYYLK